MIAENIHTHGGIQRVIQNLSASMEDKGWNVDYLDSTNISSTKILKKSIPNLIELSRWLHQNKYDAYHIHGFSSFLIFCCALFIPKNRVIYNPHWHPFRHHDHPVFAGIFYYIFSRWIIKKFHCVIVQTKYEADFFKEVGKNINIIPSGIEIEEITIVEPTNEKNEIIFVGRDDANKRLDFIELIQDEILSRGFKIKVVTNKNKKDTAAIKYYKNLKDDELSTLYQNAKYLVMPSKYESLGLVALEALSRGCMVIASDRVMLKEFCKGKDFFTVFKYGNKENFLEVFDQMINKSGIELKEIQLEGIEFANKFNQESSYDGYSKIYKQCINQSKNEGNFTKVLVKFK